MPADRLGALLAPILAAIALGACSGGDSDADSRAELLAGVRGRPNFLLISVDTLRADHLHCYGYARDTTPNLDRFAAKAVRFANVYAPAPWTLPSHATMLSGVHAFELGIRGELAKIPEDTPLVAELLARDGYQTAAFVDSMPDGFVGAERGFARGFDVFRHAPHRPNLPFRYDLKATLEAARDWLLGRDQHRPFFLFLHTKAVHAIPAERSGDPRHPPYYAPEPHLSRYLTEAQSKLTWGDGDGPKAVEYLRDLNVAFASGAVDPRAYPAERSGALKALYDGAIHYMDAEVGAFLDQLGPLGLRDDTVVIFTADHGESFVEHHFALHLEVYNDLLQVPLIVSLPALSGGRVVRTPVGLEDLAPTMLALAAAPIPERIEGRVLPLRDAGGADRRFFAYYLFGGSQSFYNAFSAQEGDWKLIRQKIGGGDWKSDVYHLTEDPEEARPVDDASRQHLQELLASWVRSNPDPGRPGIVLHPETIEHLRSLGYLP